ncbi:hypothetical protein DRO66_01865 [Candidatus Bathyarchaeota archaeon]|nr:MAG: hypothetical protein DRO66_01865 [Candidatus Bathyarchaeota archaeon]
MVVSISEFLKEGVSFDRNYAAGVDMLWSPIAEDIKIIRSKGEYVENITQGTEVFSGPGMAGNFTDSTLTEYPKVYYYVAFYFSGGVWNTSGALRGHLMMVEVGEFVELIRTRLIPPLYSLGWVTDEDSVQSLGTIMAHIIARPLEEIRNLKKALKLVGDVDETPGDFLPSLAQQVGLTPNTELSYNKQREEIKTAIPVWRRKGTPQMIAHICSVVAGVPCGIAEWSRRAIRDMVGNLNYTPDSEFFLDYNRAAPIIGDHNYDNPMMPGDRTCFALGTVGEIGNINLYDFGIFVFVEDGITLTDIQVRKLKTWLELLTPLESRYNIIIVRSKSDPGIILEQELVVNTVT